MSYNDIANKETNSVIIDEENPQLPNDINSSVTPKLPLAVGDIPNGGIVAWLQVLGAHFLFFNSWGIVNTFGAYQAYYESSLLQSHSSSQISWIGTFQGFLLIVSGIISGPIFDRGHLYLLLFSGTFLVVFGMMMTSLASAYWQIFLAQGLCVGLGGGCLFLPSVAIVATYFSSKRALAIGIMATGGSIGSVIYPIMFRSLQPRIEFAWATRVIGFLALGTLSVSIAVMKTRLPPPKHARALLDKEAFRSVPYVLFSVGLFLAFVGLYIPFFYIVVYAQTNIGVDTDLSFYLLAVLNGASAFGRIVPGLLADRFGSLEVMIGYSLGSAVLGYAWSAIHNLAGLIVFAILYGFLSGAVVSLPTTVVAGLVPDMRLVGTWMGMSFCFAGLGLLIGNPIAGTIINIEENKFTGGFIFAASMVLGGGIIFIAVKTIKSRSSKN